MLPKLPYAGRQRVTSMLPLAMDPSGTPLEHPAHTGAIAKSPATQMGRSAPAAARWRRATRLSSTRWWWW